MPKLDSPMEITGPMASKLFVSSATEDADLFLVLRLFDPDGREETFMGSTDPNTAIANGWLRVSHRALCPEKSSFYRPYHPHDKAEMLTPDDIYECDIEIVSSCIVVPAGWQLALSVRGQDYIYPGDLIGSGTCATGCLLENNLSSNNPKWLNENDVIAFKVDCLGTLRNTIVKANN